MTSPRREADWYKDWFDRDEYEVVYGHRDEADAAKLIDLVVSVAHLPHASRVLDMGCGRGRHAIPLALLGYRVVGVDLSENSIKEARRRAEALDLTIDFRVGDMREPACEDCCSLVANLFTAFGYFEAESEHEQAITSMATALHTGGWLVQDFLNADQVRRNLVPESRGVKAGFEVRQKRWIADGRINKMIKLRGPSGDQTFSESVRLLGIRDFDRMYRRSGLLLHGAFGDYDGGPYKPDSPRLLMFARKFGG